MKLFLLSASLKTSWHYLITRGAHYQWVLGIFIESFYPYTPFDLFSRTCKLDAFSVKLFD